MDKNLSWREYIDLVALEISKTIGIIVVHSDIMFLFELYRKCTHFWSIPILFLSHVSYSCLRGKPQKLS